MLVFEAVLGEVGLDNFNPSLKLRLHEGDFIHCSVHILRDCGKPTYLALVFIYIELWLALANGYVKTRL